jgi:polyribonucleotide nucleotidyltransferase
MNYTYQLELNGTTEYFETKNIARHANGSIMMRLNDTVMLATVTYEPDNPVQEDFLPLTVQYIEKAYASGKIPGGFVKRESKPGDFETLTSRMIDRSLRPLFPEGYCYPTQITNRTHD